MPPQCRCRHAVGARHQLLVRRPHDELRIASEGGLRMERQQRVEDRERTIRGTEELPRHADVLEDLPFMHDRIRLRRLGRHLT